MKGAGLNGAGLNEVSNGAGLNEVSNGAVSKDSGSVGTRRRPDRADLEAARGRSIGDVLPAAGEPLAVLLCGINPSLYSGATGHHFARPGNRFWPALHRSGFTDRRLAPHEQDLLPSYGLGITNLVDRATARADELTDEELRAGGERLAALVASVSPCFVAVAGVTAYRIAFGSRQTDIGPQPGTIGPARLWVLPNPSGLNASWTAPRIAEEFRELRETAGLRSRLEVD
jgi:TDG/mug DNA glycosylase family protein